MEEVKKKSAVKELFSHTLFYGVGLFLNRSLGIILLPLYTLYFSPGEMGLYALVYSLWLFINVIYLGGIETSFLKFFIDNKEENERKKIYGTTLITIFFTSVIFSSLIYLFSEGITSLIGFENPVKGNELVQILSLLLICDALYRIPLLLLRAELKANVYFYLTLFTLVINLGLNFFFIISLGMNVEAIFYSYLISAFLTFLLSLVFTKRFFSLRFSLSTAKRLLVFGNKFVYTGLFIILIDQSDRFFLKYFFNEGVVGVYQANYRLAAVMSLAVASFRFSWTPYFLNIADNPENKKIISTIFTYFVFAGLFLFLFFSFFTAPIVKTSFFGITILGPQYWSGLSIIPVVLLAYFLSGLASNLNAAPFYADKTGYILILTMCGCALYYVLNFILVPRFEMLGAAYANMLAQLAMVTALYFISQKIYKVEYNLKTVFSLCILAAISYGAYIIIGNSLNQFLSASIALLLFILPVHFLKVIDLRKVKMLFKKS